MCTCVLGEMGVIRPIKLANISKTRIRTVIKFVLSYGCCNPVEKSFHKYSASWIWSSDPSSVSVQEATTWKATASQKWNLKTDISIYKFTELEKLDVLKNSTVFMALKWLDSCLIKFTLWKLNIVWLGIILTTTLQYNLK